MLTTILRFHVLAGFTLDDGERLNATLARRNTPLTLETIQGQSIDVDGNLTEGFTFDGAGLVNDLEPIQASNGVILGSVDISA